MDRIVAALGSDCRRVLLLRDRALHREGLEVTARTPAATGARVPVPFFAYPDKPGWCLSADCQVLYLACEEQDSDDPLCSNDADYACQCDRACAPQD